MTEYADLHQLAANTVRILAGKFGSLDDYRTLYSRNFQTPCLPSIAEGLPRSIKRRGILLPPPLILPRPVYPGAKILQVVP